MPGIQVQNFLLPLEDGLPSRESGAWVESKLDYLNRYLDIFTTSMIGKGWRSLNYIDLFSGPGKCKIRETQRILLGSPLLSLRLKNPFNRYYFVDCDTQNIDALKQRSGQSSLLPNIVFNQGDCNTAIHQIAFEINQMDNYKKGQWSTLNFAFLDPEGLELEWSTVELLGRLKKMDLMIYYPQFGLELEMKNEINTASPTRIDKFFGDTKWRELFKEWKKGRIPSIHKALMEHYQDNLLNLGYVDVINSVVPPLMRNTQRNAPLYRIMLESKHDLGLQFWKKVVQRDVHGQLSLLGPDV